MKARPKPLGNRKVGDRMEVLIDDVATGGEGVCRVDGFVLFVPATAPGDRLEVELTVLKKKYGRARISTILEPSPQRVKPPCPVYEECGGCQFQHLGYSTQLSYKTKMVIDAVQRIGELTGVEVLPCQGMDEPWNYRNKAQMMVASGPEGKPVFGFYRQRTHSVVPVADCLIQSQENNEVLRAARDLTEKLGWQPYLEGVGSGVLRYAIARTNTVGESLLILVAAKSKLPRFAEFVEAMTATVPGLKGIALNHNPNKTNVILSPETIHLWGSDHLIEEVGGLKFRISPASFFQVNPWGLRALYQKLDHYLPLTGEEAVLDLYCGVGSMSLYLAKHAKRVVGVDNCDPAIEDARKNAALNGLGNTYFESGASEIVLPRLYEEGERFAAAVLDPPRKGCAPEVLNTVSRMRIPRLVYISCNPATLARDLGLLAEQGYLTEKVQPVDMFPQTYHVETVATLTRARS